MYLPPGDGTTADATHAQVLAGYSDTSQEDCQNNNVYRGAFRFDIPSGITVTSAILRFRTPTWYELGGYAPTIVPVSTLASCVSSLQIGNADWTTGTYALSASLLPSVPYYPLPTGDLSAKHDDLSHPTGVSVDAVDDEHAGILMPKGVYFAVEVTTQIQEWVGADVSTNQGFILVSRNEDLGASLNEACGSLFDKISLDLKYRGIFPAETTPIPNKFIPTPTIHPTPAQATPTPAQTTPTPVPMIPATPTPAHAPTATAQPIGKPQLTINPTQATGFCLNGQYPSVTVENTGNATLQWQVSPSVPITVSPSQGTLASGDTQVVQVSGSPPQPVATVVLTFTSNGGNGTMTYTCK